MTRRDDVTDELPGVPKRRGRPPSGQAKSGAERMAAYRQKLADKGMETVTISVSSELVDALRSYAKRKAADSETVTLGEAAERILRDRLLRKR